MNPSAPLEEILSQMKDAYYRSQWDRLRQTPAAALDRCWRALDDDPDHKTAADILIYRYRGGLEEDGSLDDACELVRLLELLDDGELEKTVGHALISALEVRARREMLRRSVAESDLRQNPMAVIEECFFDPDNEDESLLVGGLLMAGYRAMLYRNPETRMYALVLGMRQAYAFYRTGRADLAAAAVRWASYDFDDLREAMPPEVRAAVGKCYYATALSAKTGEHFDAHLKLLLASRSYLTEGNELAECLYSLGEEYKRRGDVVRALELYEEGLRTPGLTDRETRQVLQLSVDFLRAEWEGDFSKIHADPEAFGAFGFDGDAFNRIGTVFARLASGENLPDELVRQLLDGFRSSVRDMVAHGSPHDSILHNYVVLLKLFLGLDDPGRVPVSPAELLDEAQVYVAQARPETALDFEQVRQYLEESTPALGLRAALRGLGKLPSLREAFEQARSGHRPPAAPKDQPKPPLIERIAALADPDGRMNNLHTALAAVLHRGGRDPANVARFPLLRALGIARDSIAARLTVIPTAESAGLLRLSDDQVVRGLGMIVLAQLHGDLDSLATEKVHITWFAPPERDDVPAQALREYACLLRDTSNWSLTHYEGHPFARAMAHLNTAQRGEYQALCNRLSDAARSDVFNPSGARAEEIVSQMRRLRAIAQVADRPHRPAAPEDGVGDSPTSDEVFLVELNDGPNRLFLTLARDSAGLHCCCTSAWGELATAYDALPKDKELGNLDSFHHSFAGRQETSVSALFNSSPATVGRSIRYSCVSRTEIPLPWVCDPGDQHRWQTGRVASPRQSASPATAIACWSGMQHGAAGSLEIDEVNRTIRFLREPGRVWRYPDIPPGEGTTGLSLPASHYERWMLEDVSQATGQKPCSRSGPGASRAAFLAEDWRSVRALHLSTHGQSYRDVPECSYLVLSDGAGRTAPLTFADILACDWSNLDLVFLNACLTGSGTKRRGESALSLAWAFLAGGAKAVIANRWIVPDRTAFLFARQFYRAWMSGSPSRSVPVAFHRALAALKTVERGRLPHQWGPFTLLT